MRPSEVAMALADLDMTVQKGISALVSAVVNDFEYEGETNSDVAGQAALVKSLVEFRIVSMFSARHKKDYDKLKKLIDLQLVSMEIDPNVPSGQDSIMYEGNGMLFKKRRNIAGESVSAKDFELALAKLNVDPQIMHVAKDNATKRKEGSLYYEVELT